MALLELGKRMRNFAPYTQLFHASVCPVLFIQQTRSINVDDFLSGKNFSSRNRAMCSSLRCSAPRRRSISGVSSVRCARRGALDEAESAASGKSHAAPAAAAAAATDTSPHLSRRNDSARLRSARFGRRSSRLIGRAVCGSIGTRPAAVARATAHKQHDHHV